MVFTIAVNECNPEMLEERQRVNVKLEKISNEQTQWFDAPSPQEYRRWRKEGLHGYPKPFQHPKAEMIEIPSTKGKPIALRIIPPSGPSKGVYLHFHAGGFVIGSAASHDTLLARTAGDLSLVAVSVEYRLAPENPYPAAEEDCLEAALFALSDTGAARLGGPLRIIAGESAGGYLTIRTAIQLRNRGINIREKIAALVPGCGIFDLTYTPSLRSHQRRVIMGYQDTIKFIDSYVPPEKYTSEKRKEPQISPLYDNLSNLPPALFLVGTVDPLVDDNVFMATKYHFAGNSTEVKLVAEACHAFTLFPGEVAEEGLREISHFLHKQLDRSMTTI